MLFPSTSVDILKLDFCYEAGSHFQPLPLYASATANLMHVGYASVSPRQWSDYLDRRGILISANVTPYTAALSAYLLLRYAGEFFPLLHEMVQTPSFPEMELRAFCRRKRQEITTNLQRTSYLARLLFRQALYGADSPEGRYAVPDDVDGITADGLRAYFQDRFQLDTAMRSLSGNYDDATLAAFRTYFGDTDTYTLDGRLSEIKVQAPQHIRHRLGLSGPQASIRVGRGLPFLASDDDYAAFEVLCTVLGGYFGSRLMRNIREEKGYTYGIYSRLHILRNSLYFEVLSDVSAESVDAALTEVYREMDALCRQPVDDDELQLVRQYMEGEYLRSIDGIFERSDRWQQLAVLGLDERSYSNRLIHAIQSTTAEQLQHLAQRYLQPDAMTEVVVMG